MTDLAPEQLTITCISGLDTGDLWGVPDSPEPAGVLRAVIDASDLHVTLIIDHAYAETMIAGIEVLGAGFSLGPSAVHWMRLGWPDDWGTNFEPNAWHRCVDGHVVDLWAGP